MSEYKKNKDFGVDMIIRAYRVKGFRAYRLKGYFWCGKKSGTYFEKPFVIETHHKELIIELRDLIKNKYSNEI